MDPAIGTEFDRTDEGVGDEEDEEEDRADGEAGDDGDAEEKNSTDDVADHFAVASGFEDIGKEFGEEKAGNGGAEEPDGFEHLGEAGSFFGGSGFGEFLAHEHDPVEDRGDEVKGELVFPVDLIFIIENPASDDAEDHACRPAGVEDIEVMGPIIGEEGGDERVGDGFESPIGEGEDKHSPVEEIVGVLWGGGAEGDKSGDDVAEEGDGDEFSVADFIDD